MIIKVKGSSPVRELAGSVIKCYESGEREIELRAIGASSVNQMYKALLYNSFKVFKVNYHSTLRVFFIGIYITTNSDLQFIGMTMYIMTSTILLPPHVLYSHRKVLICLFAPVMMKQRLRTTAQIPV